MITEHEIIALNTGWIRGISRRMENHGSLRTHEYSPENTILFPHLARIIQRAIKSDQRFGTLVKP